MAENKKLQSDVKNVNHRLEEKIYFEKKQAKGKQYSRRNNIEISDLPNSIPDHDLENTVVSICKDSGAEIDPKDIEGCPRLSPSKNSKGKATKGLPNLSTGSTQKRYGETKDG